MLLSIMTNTRASPITSQTMARARTCIYSGKGLNGADFASKEDLKVGQKVTIAGKIMKFVDKNNNEIMEVDKTSSIVKIEGEGTGGEVKPDPTPDTPASSSIEMTDASILSGKSGDVELVEKYYNSQNVTNESIMVHLEDWRHHL